MHLSLFERIENSPPLVMSEEDEARFQMAKTCHICAERNRIRGANFRLKRKFLQDLDQVARKLINVEKKPYLNSNFGNESVLTSRTPTAIANSVQRCGINVDAKTENHVNLTSGDAPKNAEDFPQKPCLALNTENNSATTYHVPTSNTSEKVCKVNFNTRLQGNRNPDSSKLLDAADNNIPNDSSKTELPCNSLQESPNIEQSNPSASGIIKQDASSGGIQKESINQGNRCVVKTLEPYHSSLPQSHKTLLGTGNKHDIEKLAKDRSGSESEFIYFGLAENLKRIVNPQLHKNRELKLQISFDGLPLFESSPREFWPILCKIYVEGNPYNPFVVAVYNGYGKPKDIHQYPWKFVRELNTLLARGIEIDGEHRSV
ncbi:hypothetical protein QAD02_013754 [Eretmocerus hayati]|uniref:Uncharacterized protein n=1 Tax=Eretmocerus hayati TaxID=131215 RepID=A0ACC2P694_9HYME|nr:hypothetical protein QAD02_013754 [Eretmocerus hayati]